MNFGVDIPFVSLLGFELIHFENGESAITFSPRSEHQNSFGVAHGGVVMTLMDVTLATAARSVAPGMGVVTIDMKTSFMRPAPGDGSQLTARGRLMHRTASMAFAEATLYDSQGQACAHATGTFKYVRRPPLSGQPVNIATD